MQNQPHYTATLTLAICTLQNTPIAIHTKQPGIRKYTALHYLMQIARQFKQAIDDEEDIDDLIEFQLVLAGPGEYLLLPINEVPDLSFTGDNYPTPTENILPYTPTLHPSRIYNELHNIYIDWALYTHISLALPNLPEDGQL